MSYALLLRSSRIILLGQNLGRSTVLILSNGFELTAIFNFSTNIFSITQFMLLLFLKLFIQHTYCLISLNILWLSSTLPKLPKNVYTTIMFQCHTFWFYLQNACVRSFPSKAQNVFAEFLQYNVLQSILRDLVGYTSPFNIYCVLSGSSKGSSILFIKFIAHFQITFSDPCLFTFSVLLAESYVISPVSHTMIFLFSHTMSLLEFLLGI